MDSVIVHAAAVLSATWDMLQDASIYIVIGLVAGGLLTVFLPASYVASHLGRGRFSSVLKASLIGIPLPLCSCGVLPAAASLKKQGANNGATTAFLISTPESGVDSISISWALLDPLMTIFRPVAAFVTALVAGVSENILNPPDSKNEVQEQNCATDSCCSGNQCCAEDGKKQKTFPGKIMYAISYACTELWGDLAGPFFIGVLLAGIISATVPDTFFQAYLGGGVSSMLVMLVFGIPLYICATASTPVAAAFILKGVSPGAALVFLLVGPATNITSISVLVKMLGKRATVVYLLSIAMVSILFGLFLDQLYFYLGISAQAAVGRAAEITPVWLKTMATVLILMLSVKPLARIPLQWFSNGDKGDHCASGTGAHDNHEHVESTGHVQQTECTCGGSHRASIPFEAVKKG